ncbi:MAG TPA: twitching motility protein PilT, partial [Actinomycetes bacterium]
AHVPSIGTRTALQAGRLLGEARMHATVDALIVAEAISAAPCVILTSDPDDMKALVGDRTHVRIEPI